MGFLLYRSITILFNLIEILIVVRILFSFININSGGPLVGFIYQMTEPILSPAKELMSKLKLNTGMFDFSPLVAILFLRLAHSLAARILL